MVTETKLIVRYAETDQMGVAHHSNYPVWFEAGRTDFLEKIGIPNSEIEGKGILQPLCHMDCSFKNPARYEDRIIIKTKLRKFTCARVEYEYEVVSEGGGRLIAAGSTSHAWTDRALKPQNVEKRLPQICMKIKHAMEE